MSRLRRNDFEIDANLNHIDNYLDMNKDTGSKNDNSKNYKEKFIYDSYSLAKKLINSLPIVPRTDLIHQLAQDIERGDFEDISTNEQAESNWDAWLSRARQILRYRNIILSKRLKKNN